MYTFVKAPHLPKGRAVSLIIGEKYRRKLEPALKNVHISAFWMPDNKKVDPRLSGHTDLTVIHLGEEKIVISESFMRHEPVFVKSLTIMGAKIYPSGTPQKREYPFDSCLNACIAGNCIIHKLSITDPAIKHYLPLKTPINVQQGYTKCSVCVVDEASIITSDEMIAKEVSNAGIEPLLIEPGHIELEGFKTGFIGGTAFKTERDEMVFTGTLDQHPDKLRIEAFLQRKHVRPIYLTNHPAFDIGSAIPLFEKAPGPAR